MPNYRDTLRELLAQAPEDLSDDDLADLAATAQTLSRLGVASPALPAPPASPPEDRKAAARARLAEISASPLGAGARDHQRLARAREREQLLAVVHDLPTGRVDHNGHFRPSGGGDAA